MENTQTAPQAQASIKGISTPSDNPVLNLLDNGPDKTVHLTGVDPDSQLQPYNPDDLYQKAGDYSIYEDMMQDDQVSVAMAVKKDLIIGSGWHIATEESEQADIKRMLEVALSEDIESSFEDCLSEIVTAYENGFSVTEKQFKTKDDGSITLKNLKTRNPVSWLFHQDKFGKVTRYEQQGTTAEFHNIDPNSIIHFVNNPRYGNPYGTSDLRAAYTAYFIKKQIVRFYAIFLEKAASPIPIAKYDRNIGLDAEIQKIHDTIKKLQTSSAMTIPKDFDVEFLQTSGNGDAYIRGINLFNMFIGRALFVPDLLGFQGGETSGGSQALGREQMVVFFKHIMRRRRTLENLVNHHIIKPLVIWNYGIMDNYPKFKLNPIEEAQAVENAKLWLDAVKGRVFEPTAEEINHFKRICEFPESSDEEIEDEDDPIEEAATEAKIPDDGTEDKSESEASETQQVTKDEPAKFAKEIDLPGNYHQKTDFAAIEKQLDSHLDLFLAKATPLVKDLFEKFADKLATMKITSATKLEKLEKVTLPKAELRRVEKLLDEILTNTFKTSMEMASGEIVKSNFKVLPAKEFLKALEEEDYNFINDWGYQITKRARTEIIAAVKDGRPISSVIDLVTTDGLTDSFTAVERYARTKLTEVMNKGRLEYFNSTGVVGGYQYSAILDDRTSGICAELHGKIFKAGQEPVPPLHFNCRSVLVPLTVYEEWTPDTKTDGGQNLSDFIEENKGDGFATK